VVTTRRALLGAGAVALLSAGCGPPDQPETVPADVLREQLRAEQAVLVASESVGNLPMPDAFQRRRLAERTRERIELLTEALVAEGADPDVPEPEPPAEPGLEALLAAERRALRVHVQAVGRLRDPKWSELLGRLVAGSAMHEPAVLALLGRPVLPSPFPGQPLS